MISWTKILFLLTLLMVYAKKTTSTPFGKLINISEETKTSSITSPDWSNEKGPLASSEALERNIKEFLWKPRNHEEDENYKSDVMVKLAETFKKYGLLTEIQAFPAKIKGEEDSGLYGMNVIGIFKGHNWGTPKDQITIIGSHYDTVFGSPGVDDNGSGVSAMLEVARVITGQCKLNNSIIFVAFDLEEYGSLGSKFFVSQYFIPEYISSSKATFQGAFIVDSVLNFDEDEFSQSLPDDVEKIAPEMVKRMSKNGQRGNFLKVVSREGFDERNSETYKQHWQSLDNPSMKLEEVVLPATDSTLMAFMLKDYPNLVRSDHASFWLHNHLTDLESLPAVFLSDTGPFRGKMKKCYHNDCDDLSMLTEKNLFFLTKTTNALIRTALTLSTGRCETRRSDKVQQHTNIYETKIIDKIKMDKLVPQQVVLNHKLANQERNQLNSGGPQQKYKRELKRKSQRTNEEREKAKTSESTKNQNKGNHSAITHKSVSSKTRQDLIRQMLSLHQLNSLQQRYPQRQGHPNRIHANRIHVFRIPTVNSNAAPSLLSQSVIPMAQDNQAMIGTAHGSLPVTASAQSNQPVQGILPVFPITQGSQSAISTPHGSQPIVGTAHGILPVIAAPQNSQQAQGSLPVSVTSETLNGRPSQPLSYEIQGDYVLPNNEILAQLPQTASHALMGNIAAQELSSQTPNSQNSAILANFDSSSQQIDPSQIQINPLVQPLTNDQSGSSPSSSNIFFGSGQQAAAGNFQSALSQASNPAQDLQFIPQRRITLPAGFYMARNAYTRLVNGMRRIAPFFG